MKQWREAATLILALRYAGANSSHLAGAPLRPEAVTSINAPKSPSTRPALSAGVEDYRVLLLKRSATNRFMPARVVFPGGVTQSVDHSPDWCPLYRRVLGLDPSELVGGARVKGKGVRSPGHVPPMIAESRGAAWGVPADVAFRICAIRETFEESGLLLCTDSASLGGQRGQRGSLGGRGGQGGPGAAGLLSSRLDAHALAHWRSLVQKDASQFLRMCDTLALVPHVSALAQWRNWLTPPDEEELVASQGGAGARAGHGKGDRKEEGGRVGSGKGAGSREGGGAEKSRRRFDTMFYLCCVDEAEALPGIAADNQETLDAEWYSPSELLRLAAPTPPDAPPGDAAPSRPHLAPPQLYELVALQQCPSLGALRARGERLSEEGTRRWMPRFSDCGGELAILLPGDYKYPATVDYMDDSSFEGGQLRSVDPPLPADSHPLNRIVFHDATMRYGTVLCNID